MIRTVTPVKNTDLHNSDFIVNFPEYRHTLFFDIETTGFSPKTTSLYMIGAAFFDEVQWQVVQWFCDSPADEGIVLADFFNFAGNYSSIAHFNGDGFDIPYILEKCKMYNLPYNFDNFASTDLFKEIKRFGRLLKTENYKQKTIENFLGIGRDDKYTGGDLIHFYQEYVQTRDNMLKEALFLHNYEDLCGLVKLVPMLNYRALIDGCFNITSLDIIKSTTDAADDAIDAVFTAVLEYPLPKRISGGSGPYYFTAYNDTLKVKVKIYTDELKFFYSNYKDYYYLPYEDTAIHKSVAFYVDKNFRTRAKAANCYSKKTGTFLPQSQIVVEPYFKIEYNHKETYFELEDSFRSNPKLQADYILHIIYTLL